MRFIYKNMTSVRPRPLLGDVLDRPADPSIRRAYYTDVLNALHKIDVKPNVVPDIVQEQD